MVSKKLLGLGSILFVMIIWGSTYAVTKIVIGDIPPFTLAFFRCLIGSVVLLVILLISKKGPPKSYLAGIPWLPIGLMGVLGVTLFYIFFNLSVQLTSASVGALIQGFLPLCIALFAAIFLSEKLSGMQVVGVVLSVIGVALIGFLSQGKNDMGNSITGNLYMVIAVIAWAAYTIISKKIAHVDSLLKTSLSTFVGTLCLLPLAMFENRHPGWPAISVNGWLAIIYLGALASGICYFLYNKSLQWLTAAQVGNFTNLDPVIGLIIALLFLHEHINMVQISGAVLVLAGIVLSTRGARPTV